MKSEQLRAFGIPTSLMCTHPTRVKTPSGDTILAPCNRCEHCRLRMANRNTNLIVLEAYCHYYTEFVTLTYSDEAVPLCYFNDCSGGLTDIVDPETGEILQTAFETDDQRHTRHESVRNGDIRLIDGLYPCLSKRDVQLFFKRLRISAYRKTQENMRYFIVGEYGPSTKRPHYHALIFHNSRRLHRIFKSLVAQCWKLGHTDTSLSRGNCASYVSSYVAGLAGCHSVYDAKLIKQFCLHSQRLGEKPYHLRFPPRLGVPSFAALSAFMLPIDGKARAFCTPKSYKRSRFPKCYHFSLFSDAERMAAYCFADFVDKECIYLERLASGCCKTPRARYYMRLFQLFDEKGNDVNPSETPELYKVLLNRIKEAYRVSCRFFRLCREYDLSNFDMYHAIVQYYTDADYSYLIGSYEELEELSKQDPSVDYHPFFFPNGSTLNFDDSVCALHDTVYHNLYSKRVKRKHFNDKKKYKFFQNHE